MDSPSYKEIVRRLAVIMIALWWGGLNCVAGCLLAPSSAAASEPHCSMSMEGDCCLSQTGSKDTASTVAVTSPSASLQPLACCSLEAISAEVKRDVRSLDVVAIIPPISWQHSTPERITHAALLDRWACLPDRGGTYLLHCVFLI